MVLVLEVAHLDHHVYLFLCDLFFQLVSRDLQVLCGYYATIVIIVDAEYLAELVFLVPTFYLLGHEGGELLLVNISGTVFVDSLHCLLDFLLF